MEGSAKIVSLISSDEFLHLAITQNIINLYKKSENDPLMLQVIADTQGDVEEIYKQVVAQEKEWADHLFNDGRGMLGLSAKLLHNYIEYLGNKRLKSIGYSPLFPEHKTNPFEHLESFFNPRNLQVAPQETELSTYITSGTKQDVDATTFSNFEL
jgi:ribonucleoside-diphosphate reductase beta chain